MENLLTALPALQLVHPDVSNAPARHQIVGVRFVVSMVEEDVADFVSEGIGPGVVADHDDLVAMLRRPKAWATFGPEKPGT